MGGAFLINLDRIRPDPSQPRTVFNPAALNELATSIRRLGVVQPISVRCIPAADIYQIISGERRFQASKLAGLSTIPAVIANPDENEILVRQLVENWHRQDLNPFDLADSLVQLRECMAPSSVWLGKGRIFDPASASLQWRTGGRLPRAAQLPA